MTGRRSKDTVADKMLSVRTTSSSAAAASTRRGRGLPVLSDGKWRSLLPAAVTGVVLVVAWQISSVAGFLPASSFPSATATAHELGSQLIDASFWTAMAQTMWGWGVGLGLAAALALPLGLLLGLMGAVRRSTSFVVEFLKPIPPVALIPLALLFWGPSLRMKLFLVVFGTLWPLMIQTSYGVLSVDPMAREMARSYGLSRGRVLKSVVLPSVLPFAATGLRIAASIALVIDIVSELVGGAPGLGKSIIDAQSDGALAKMYGYILFTGFLGLVVNLLFTAAERPLLRWHPSGRRR